MASSNHPDLSSASNSSFESGRAGGSLLGISLASVSGASFGLIPLFTIPVLAAGMDCFSVIFYRFMFGSLAMLLFLMYRRVSLRLTRKEVLDISILSFIYIICAITLFKSYDYISSGVATSLIYTNPIWCSLLGIMFCGERFSWRITISLVLAVVGVMLLSGFFDAGAVFSPLGILLGLCSGIGYGIYLILLPRLRLSRLPSLTLTFYIFFFAMLYIMPLAWVFGAMGMDLGMPEGSILSPIVDVPMLINLILVGLLPTAFSNICITMSLRMIDTTVVSILGALEPFTAMLIGIFILGESFTALTIIGGLMVLLSVVVITLRSAGR